MKLKKFETYLNEKDEQKAGYKADVELLANIELLGLQLQELRNKTGINQKELAEKLHITQQRISEIEKLKNGNITLKTLLQYTEKLGYNIHFTLEKISNESVL
jgi:DNA-binding XRE family transcriptional regulator